MTTTSNVYEQDAPQPALFSALLTPHRSLNRTGFLVLMVFLCAISFAAGMVFLLMGAWPVFGFFGLDVLRSGGRSGSISARATACEEITVTPSELRVRRVSHRGHVVEWVLNPLWVRLDRKEDPEFGIERLYLVSQGPAGVGRQFSGAGRKGQLCQSFTGCTAGRQARPDL